MALRSKNFSKKAKIMPSLLRLTGICLDSPKNRRQFDFFTVILERDKRNLKQFPILGNVYFTCSNKIPGLEWHHLKKITIDFPFGNSKSIYLSLPKKSQNILHHSKMEETSLNRKYFFEICQNVLAISAKKANEIENTKIDIKD